MRRRFPILKAAEEAIFESMSVSLEDIRGKNRAHHVVSARVLFAHLCQEAVYPDLYLSSYLNKDHSTLSFWFKTYEDRVRFDDGTFKKIREDVVKRFNEKQEEYGIF